MEHTQDESASLEAPADFSLVLGGPLYQLYLRCRLARPSLELAARRTIAIPLIAWLPLLLLALVEGHALPATIAVPFAYDLEVHARYLLALPLLIAAELIVHMRLRPIIGQFLARGIVPPPARARFDAILASAMRLRNSVPLEISMIVFVYTVLHVFWRSQTLQTPTWFATQVAPAWRLSWAGWWYSYVSVPIFQFILLRWYFRLFIWLRLLWQVSRLELCLVPTHPDRAGGLGFLGGSVNAFTPVLLAQTVLVSGVIANRIFHEGSTLPAFKVEIIGIVVMLVIIVLAPLTVFAPHLVAAKRSGLREYGALAARYVQEFDAKWVRGGAGKEEPLIGSGDIQSLADLANSFEVIRGMRPVPFGRDTVLQLVVIIALPFAPLLLTVIPLEELLKSLLAVLL